MTNFKPIALILALLVLITAWLSAYTVDETETAIKFRLGRMVEEGMEPGLHWKIPFIETVRRFDDRVHTLDEPPSRFLTSEKKNVIVDAFVKWRIADPSQFYVSLAGNPGLANQRLSEIIKSGLRTEFGKRTIQEVISGERRSIMDLLNEQASSVAKPLRLEVVEVRIQRIDLPSDVSESVYQRMAAERERVARDFRARGREQAERIRAEADRERTVLIAEARREAEELRGLGEAEATRIFAEAYNRDRDFFEFYRSLEAYVNAFDERSDVLVLDPNESQFFRFFDQSRPGR